MHEKKLTTDKRRKMVHGNTHRMEVNAEECEVSMNGRIVHPETFDNLSLHFNWKQENFINFTDRYDSAE